MFSLRKICFKYEHKLLKNFVSSMNIQKFSLNRFYTFCKLSGPQNMHPTSHRRKKVKKHFFDMIRSALESSDCVLFDALRFISIRYLLVSLKSFFEFSFFNLCSSWYFPPHFYCIKNFANFCVIHPMWVYTAGRMFFRIISMKTAWFCSIKMSFLEYFYEIYEISES